jgi:hypothetical protein
LKLLKVRVMRIRAMATTAMQGGGSPDLRFIDFPSAMGLLPIQGCSGGAVAARQRHVFFGTGVIEVLRDWLYFSIYLGLFCKDPGLISPDLSHKKRYLQSLTVVGTW